MIHKDFECEFYFIRHGESESNAAPEFAAGVNFDSDLTPKGFVQARLLGERLEREKIRFDKVYSSSLRRAIDTTRTMLGAMGEGEREFPRVDALIEQQIPGWRGVPRTEAFSNEMLAYMRGKGAHFVPPEGESYRMVQRRVANWLEDEIIYNPQYASKALKMRVAVVGHGAATRCLFHYIMSYDEVYMGRMAIDNCSISRFRFSGDGWTPVCINDSSHILTADVEAGASVAP